MHDIHNKLNLNWKLINIMKFIYFCMLEAKLKNFDIEVHQ